MQTRAKTRLLQETQTKTVMASNNPPRLDALREEDSDEDEYEDSRDNLEDQRQPPYLFSVPNISAIPRYREEAIIREDAINRAREIHAILRQRDLLTRRLRE